jgi:arginine utilization protein RocB
MTASSAPRTLVELQNTIALVREAYVILDQELVRTQDDDFGKLSDTAFDLLQALRAKLDEREVGTGYGWLVPQTIEIRNKETV